MEFVEQSSHTTFAYFYLDSAPFGYSFSNQVCLAAREAKKTSYNNSCETGGVNMSESKLRTMSMDFCCADYQPLPHFTPRLAVSHPETVFARRIVFQAIKYLAAARRA